MDGWLGEVFGGTLSSLLSLLLGGSGALISCKGSGAFRGFARIPSDKG